MACKYYLYAGRWRELDTSTGRVDGWRERTQFVYLKAGKLHRARSEAVLRGLRSLASGCPTNVFEGPSLPSRRHNDAQSKKRKRVADHHRCYCELKHRCSVDANCNSIHRAPVPPPPPPQAPAPAPPPPQRVDRADAATQAAKSSSSDRGSAARTKRHRQEDGRTNDDVPKNKEISPRKKRRLSENNSNSSELQTTKSKHDDVTPKLESPKKKISQDTSPANNNKDFPTKRLLRTPKKKRREVVSSDSDSQSSIFVSNKSHKVKSQHKAIPDNDTKSQKLSHPADCSEFVSKLIYRPNRVITDDSVSHVSNEEEPKELVITENEIETLRTFLMKNISDADLYQFDNDDNFKAMIFYKINPLVRLNKCCNIDNMALMQRDHREMNSLKQFAKTLGLRSVTDISNKEHKRYITRNSILERDSLNRKDYSTNHDSENETKCKRKEIVKSKKSGKTIKALKSSTDNRESHIVSVRPSRSAEKYTNSQNNVNKKHSNKVKNDSSSSDSGSDIKVGVQTSKSPEKNTRSENNAKNKKRNRVDEYCSSSDSGSDINVGIQTSKSPEKNTRSQNNVKNKKGNRIDEYSSSSDSDSEISENEQPFKLSSNNNQKVKLNNGAHTKIVEINPKRSSLASDRNQTRNSIIEKNLSNRKGYKDSSTSDESQEKSRKYEFEKRRSRKKLNAVKSSTNNKEQLSKSPGKNTRSQTNLKKKESNRVEKGSNSSDSDTENAVGVQLPKSPKRNTRSQNNVMNKERNGVEKDSSSSDSDSEIEAGFPLSKSPKKNTRSQNNVKNKESNRVEKKSSSSDSDSEIEAGVHLSKSPKRNTRSQNNVKNKESNSVEKRISSSDSDSEIEAGVQLSKSPKRNTRSQNNVKNKESNSVEKRISSSDSDPEIEAGVQLSKSPKRNTRSQNNVKNKETNSVERRVCSSDSDSEIEAGVQLSKSPKKNTRSQNNDKNKESNRVEKKSRSSDSVSDSSEDEQTFKLLSNNNKKMKLNNGIYSKNTSDSKKETELRNRGKDRRTSPVMLRRDPPAKNEGASASPKKDAANANLDRKRVQTNTKRRSVGGGREYSLLEDHAIVAWVSTGSRCRLVNGNRLWKELQQEYHRLTGESRSWHSLRNRYLRYILPKLGALALPYAHAARLRAGAAKGEIKSKRRSNSNRASINRIPVTISAWSRRPHDPAASPRDPAASPRDPAASSRDPEPGTSEQYSNIGTSTNRRLSLRRPHTPPSATPSYAEVTRAFAAKHRGSPESAASPLDTRRATRSRPAGAESPKAKSKSTTDDRTQKKATRTRRLYNP